MPSVAASEEVLIYAATCGGINIQEIGEIFAIGQIDTDAEMQEP